MKTTTRTFAAFAAAAVLAVGGGLTASALTDDAAPVVAGSTAVSAGLSAELGEKLQLTREEERMARDLYAALAEAHTDARPMSTITNSEERHHDAVGALLDRYGVSDPSAGRSAGSYAFPEIQKLYDAWYAKGKTSLNAAYQVGVELEKWDIAALQKDVAATSQADVKQLYTTLLTASQHHLSAYEAAVSGRPLEPGSGMGNGGGRGNGMFKGMGDRLHKGMGAGMGGWGQGQNHGPGMRGDWPMIDGNGER